MPEDDGRKATNSSDGRLMTRSDPFVRTFWSHKNGEYIQYKGRLTPRASNLQLHRASSMGGED
jgi:hypothetical protein